MKRLLFLLAFFGILSFGFSQHKSYVYFPENINAPLTAKEKQQITSVFGEFSQTIFSNKTLLKNYKDILRNRVVLIPINLEKYSLDPKFHEIPELSSVPLFTTYNGSLQVDRVINKDTFNPLKYEINFFPREATIYRQANYLIKILPQQKQDNLR